MRFTWILGIAVCAGGSVAQTFTADEITHVGRYDLDTGVLTPPGETYAGTAPPAVVYDNTEFAGSFYLPGTDVVNVDWGELDAVGQNEILEVEIGYATSSTAAIAMYVTLYSDTAGFGDIGTELLTFGLTGLPASSSGSAEAFAVTVDLGTLAFELPDGPIGYGYEFRDEASGPLLVGPPNPDGVFNGFDQYMLDGTYIGTNTFGGTPFASFYIALTGQQPALVPRTPARLQVSEFATTPTDGEFVEIFNPNSFPVDLSDTYLTDATFAGGSTFYYQIVEGGGGGGSFGDWFARFPDGASIEAGEYQTVACAGSTAFAATFGVDPTYELYEDDGSPDGIPDMREARPGSIDGQGGLTNFGEVVVLFHWDGESDLVDDLDYIVYGDKVEGVDKTGVSIDGPDGDTDASTYADDTPIASQDGAPAGATGAHANGDSWQRLHLSEGTEVRTGGNGVSGNDETSENVSFTWVEAAATPNTGTDGSATVFATPGSTGPNTIELRGATPSGLVFFFATLGEDLYEAPGCPGEGLGLDLSTHLFLMISADANGELDLPAVLPSSVGDVEVLLQVVDFQSCVWTNVTTMIF